MNGAGAIFIVWLVIMVLKFACDLTLTELRPQKEKIKKQQYKNSWQDFDVSDGELYYFDNHHDDIF